ncbi:MAG: flavodoxin-dependent (E)-4-hydroxy-3-methylbut-2-enyl-diphosphate synthase [Armatimonadetes bacterium]|nr:flavodoxin-dependent (E)-4-hydroxy-3-methylbut-2-enyl-diphosphate synthase [Armatimonadota bacterium]
MPPDAFRKQPPWPRRATRSVRVGDVVIGGGAPVSIQTMTKTDTLDVDATLEQIRRSVIAGAELVRVAVPRMEAVEAFAEIVREAPVPIIADVHFHHEVAVAAVRAGAHKLRINPGNIGDDERLARVVEAAGEAGVPVRVGVNSGSLERDILERDGGVTARGLAESALRSVERMHALGFEDLVVSIKASEVPLTVAANRAFAEQSDLPLHLGITEAGMGRAAEVKSAVGLGVLLAEGIGDTIRVSMTDPPEDEAEVGVQILRSLGLRRGPWLISCPTCGRCQVDLRPIAARVSEALQGMTAPLAVAVMGCEVNGPGEARQADIGLACGRGRAVIFARGERLLTVPIQDAAETLIEHMTRLAADFDDDD